MRKLLSLLLTLTLLISSVIPTYATSLEPNAQQVLFVTMKNTLEQANAEAFGENFFKTYDTTFKKFLSTLVTGGEVTLNVTSTNGYDDELSSDELTFTYNDDGSSLLLTLNSNDGSDVPEIKNPNSTYSIYIDDTKIMYEEFEYYDDEPERVIYYFGDSLAGTGFAPKDIGFDFNYLKYSNVKSYINTLLTLESSGKLDAIYKDYFNNFLVYLAKADITYENNTLTLVIDDVWIKEYITQLATKVQNDKNLIEVYESLNLDYDYEDMLWFVTSFLFGSRTVPEALEDVPADLEYKYVGVVSNGVFVKNSFTSYYDGELNYSYSIDFNNAKNSLLSDVEVNNFDGYNDNKFDFSLKNNFGKRTVTSKRYIDSELLSEDTFTYTIDGLNVTTIGETLRHVEPYFYQEEAPKKVQQSYDEWFTELLSDYKYNINSTAKEIAYADKQITTLEKAVNSTTTTPVYLDLKTEYSEQYLRSLESFSIYEYEYSPDAEPYVDFTNGKVFNNQTALTIFKAYKEDLSDSYDVNLKHKNDFVANAKDLYKKYCDNIENRYQKDLLEYNKYLQYVADGKPKNIYQTNTETNTLLTDNNYIGKFKEEKYKNNTLEYTTFVELFIEKSDAKNTVNTDGATPLADY